MATTPHLNPARIFSRRGYGQEIQRRRTEDASSRASATNILDPMDVAGEYDAGRLLMTTLGGTPRAITLDDLRHFQSLAGRLGKRYKGGINAKGVIDHSRQDDRDRANGQIRTAVVMAAKAGVLHFITNAGPGSEHVRHHVHVEWPMFPSFASAPQKADRIARTMLDGPLKFDCDCERHRYWYRYIATKGGFNYGRPETGYPKIRNPKLVGVACKHVLRVMRAILKDANVKSAAARMIAAAQANDLKVQRTTNEQARDMARQQQAQSHHLKNRVETSQQAAARQAATPAGRARALAAAAKVAEQRAQQAQQRSRKAVASAMEALTRMPMTKAQRDALIAQLQAAKTVD